MSKNKEKEKGFTSIRTDWTSSSSKPKDESFSKASGSIDLIGVRGGIRLQYFDNMMNKNHKRMRKKLLFWLLRISLIDPGMGHDFFQSGPLFLGNGESPLDQIFHVFGSQKGCD